MSAGSGEQALSLVAQRPPDLILLDVMMPGLNGYEVARKLKANTLTSAIPIIMVTALIDRAVRLAGLDAGAEDFLEKPVDRAELWLRVRNLLRLKALADLLQDHSAAPRKGSGGADRANSTPANCASARWPRTSATSSSCAKPPATACST